MTIQAILDARFGGVLTTGSHPEDGAACALEAASVARGIPWTDDPNSVGLPDLRPLNDGRWSSDVIRTTWLVPLIEALWRWPDWPEARRGVWASRVAERTIREVLPIALRAAGLDAEAARCAREGTPAAANAAANAAAKAAYNAANVAAYNAANAAAYAAAYDAAYDAANVAAYNAAYAARAATDAADAAAHAATANAVLVLACRIWQEEALR